MDINSFCLLGAACGLIAAALLNRLGTLGFLLALFALSLIAPLLFYLLAAQSSGHPREYGARLPLFVLPAAGCGIVSGLLYRLGWRLWRIIRP